jgi:hypothetical protein
MKTSHVILLFIFLITFSVGSAQSSATDVVYIRIQEDIGEARCESLMTIAYPNGKTEEIGLVEIGFKAAEAKQNTMTIRNKLNALVNEGYSIESTSASANSLMAITVIVLIRKNGQK